MRVTSVDACPTHPPYNGIIRTSTSILLSHYGSTSIAYHSIVQQHRCESTGCALFSIVSWYHSTTRHVRKAQPDLAQITCCTRLKYLIFDSRKNFFVFPRVPLDHIFATAARVYRRFRLRPALSFWHSFAVSETRRLNRITKASTTIQSLVRMFLARRLAMRFHLARGPAAVGASKVIQSGFRAQKTREIVAERATRRQKREELWEVHRQNETARAQRGRRDASVVIQASWRGAIGRLEGAERARRKLTGVLVDLGGGQGRIHRYVHRCGRIVNDSVR